MLNKRVCTFHFSSQFSSFYISRQLFANSLPSTALTFRSFFSRHPSQTQYLHSFFIPLILFSPFPHSLPIYLSFSPLSFPLPASPSSFSCFLVSLWAVRTHTPSPLLYFLFFYVPTPFPEPSPHPPAPRSISLLPFTTTIFPAFLLFHFPPTSKLFSATQLCRSKLLRYNFLSIVTLISPSYNQPNFYDMS